ncbi:hypothetical protein Lfu02_79160 [Longispora fulva]|nr:hypothetical protein Lfu02_79160 [Longispora fulva]
MRSAGSAVDTEPPSATPALDTPVSSAGFLGAASESSVMVPISQLREADPDRPAFSIMVTA